MTNKLHVRLNGRSIDREHLDITSYLSALNRFNSCKKHIWTVYPIFTDLNDMGWQKELTAFYKLATHHIDIIVETHTNETWQMHKAEQGKQGNYIW